MIEFNPEQDSIAVNAIRFLAIDAIQQANSGHPGAPMGMAPAAFVLWRHFLKHNPANPAWLNRDRFVLSAGHASMLIYALLHLSGYDLPLDEIKRFRQWGSRTAGHPEHGLTPGVETTTGPLGQGFANAVGMALSERLASHDHNRPDHPVIDHRTYVFASDGDIEEGIASEAASRAGVWRLNKLVCLYDDNGITIDGPAEMHLGEDVGARFKAYGWRVHQPVEGNDLAAIAAALEWAQDANRPSLIPIRSTIGYGSPNLAGSSKTHGAPLGAEEAAATRANLNWPHGPFEVPEEARAAFQPIARAGAAAERSWNELAQRYQRDFPDAWRQLTEGRASNTLAQLFDELRGEVASNTAATRATSGLVINRVTKPLPALVGGSADLAESNNSIVKHRTAFSPANLGGRNFYFGVREHAMGGISNGIALHGHYIPYAATFLIFSDYMRNSIRMSALLEQQAVWVLTHDSIGLGEDGPTHQPISQLMGLRMIPNLLVIRPADAIETVSAWQIALASTKRPTVLSLSRQKLPPIASMEGARQPTHNQIAKGGYVAADCEGTPDLILIATGSELSIALEARAAIGSEATVRVVSLPCWELFAEQTQAYRDEVLPPAVTRRITLEAGTTIGWDRYAGSGGATIGIDHFGASASAPVLYEKFGITAANVAAKARQLLDR